MRLAKNKKIRFIILVSFLLLVVSCLLIVDAVSAFDKSASDYLKDIGKKVDLGKKDVDVPTMVGTIINGILGFLGIVFLILIIYAGLKWMMAGGAEEDVHTARQIIKWAIIGVIVVIGAYALSYYVVDEILKSTAKPIIPEMPIEDDETYDCDLIRCEDYDNQQFCLGPIDDYGYPCCQWVDYDQDPGSVGCYSR